MLSSNCSEWSTGRAYIPFPTVTIVKWCHTVMQTVLTTKKVVPGLAHEKRKLKIEKLTNIVTSEVILQPSQTYMANHSCRNSQQLKVVNYFRRKTPPQKFFWAPHTSLYLTWLIFQKKCVSGIRYQISDIRSDKQCLSNNREIDSLSNHVL